MSHKSDAPSTKRVHPELRAAIARHQSATPTHRRATVAALVDVARTLNAANVHLLELEDELHLAEQAAADLDTAPNIRWLHDEVAAVRHRGELLKTAFREYTQAYANLERALTRPEAAILRDMGIETPRETANEAPPVLTAPPPSP